MRGLGVTDNRGLRGSPGGAESSGGGVFWGDLGEGTKVIEQRRGGL